jgi:hypothetical protein
MEDVSDFHRLADDPIDDHGTPIERDAAQAGRKVVARSPGMRQQGDAPAPFANARDVAPGGDRTGADTQRAAEYLLRSASAAGR